MTTRSAADSRLVDDVDDVDDLGDLGDPGDVGLFLYGVVELDRDLPELTGLDGAPVTVLRHELVAAAVSEVRLDRPPGRRKDLVAYTGVLDALASTGVVAPVRFGTALADERTVLDDLLGPQGHHLAEVLESLRGRRQFNLRATYVEDVVLGEIVRDDPEVRALRERTRDLPEEVAYGDRVRLGELVARSLEARAADDAAALMEAVLPLVVAEAPRAAPGAQSVVDVALLVDDARVESLERRLEELAETVHDRIRLRLVGPVAPFDFVGEI